jgi:hypothetical protein
VGLCRYCFTKAGLFKDSHDKCVAEAEAALSLLRTAAADAVRSGHGGSQTTAGMQEIIQRGRLGTDEAKAAMLKAVDKATYEYAVGNAISTEEADRVGELFKSIEPTWFDKPESLIRWDGYMALIHSNTVHELLNARVPYYTPEMSSGFRLGHDEHPIVRRNATLAEYKSVSTGSTFQSISLPVGGGLYYKLGQSHPNTRQTGLVPVDGGLMLVTTHAIYFGGDLNTFRIPYHSILRIEPFVDGFGIFENYGAGKVFIPSPLGSADEGWFFYNVVSALLGWESNSA